MSTFSGRTLKWWKQTKENFICDKRTELTKPKIKVNAPPTQKENIMKTKQKLLPEKDGKLFWII